MELSFREWDDPFYWERLTAEYLKGKQAPPFNPGFDVYDSILVPDLTFQVKYANVISKKCGHGQDIWQWTQSNIEKCDADYFILYGIREGNVSMFCIPRSKFIAEGTRYANGRLCYQGHPYPTADRRRYHFTPKLWKWHVSDPTRLHERIAMYETFRQARLL